MEERPPKSDAPVQLILLAALGSLLFTIAGGFFLFRNTQRVVEAGRWVTHTQDVLLSIAGATDLTQRLESGTRLYKVTQDELQLLNSRRNAVQLRTRVTHLRSLVGDNPQQSANLDALDNCSVGLSHDLSANSLDDSEISHHLLQCQQALSLMSGLEQELL